jgi:hypothetical protein
VLIDWGSASFAVTPIVQINDFRREQFTAGTPSADCLGAFLDGLGLGPLQQQAMLPALNQWLLLEALDLVRWANDQCPSRIEETARSARLAVDAYESGDLSLHLL